MINKYTKLEIHSSGRYAVLARRDKDSPWIEIDVCSNEAMAKWLMDRLEEDDVKRNEYIDEE